MKRRLHSLHLSPTPHLVTLARALVRAGRLGESQARALGGPRLAERLVATGVMSANDLAAFIAESFGYPLLDVASLDPHALPRGLLIEDFMVEHAVLPLARRGMRLTVAMADPTDMDLIEALRQASGLQPDPVVAPVDALRREIGRLTPDYVG